VICGLARVCDMLSPSTDTAGLPKVYRNGALVPRAASELKSQTDADVIIVGAGFTGVSAALHLAEAGRKPLLIEAQEVGWGASGRNFGQVVPYTKNSEAHVLKHFGPVHGPRLLEATANGPDLVFELIKRLGISCSATRTGILFSAHSQDGLRGLQTRAEFWQKRGAPVGMLDDAATATITGSQFYKAAMIDRRGGVINPLAFACGMAQAAINAGAVLHTGARVLSMNHTGSKWTLTTKDAVLTTSEVIIATDAYSDAFAPDVRDAMIPMRAYQLVSKPLGENVRRAILPEGQSMIDTRRLFSGVRMHHDGRLHVSLDGPVFSVGQPHLTKAEKRVRELYPLLGDIEWEETWSGWVGMTADHYPSLVKIGPGCHAAMGYNGRGIALATLFGRELARHLTGTPAGDLLVPITTPAKMAAKPYARPLVGSLMALYRVLDKVDDYRLKQQRGT
jgi:glycine/D-amino acid oxidase-like deaminating enzyme